MWMPDQLGETHTYASDYCKYNVVKDLVYVFVQECKKCYVIFGQVITFRYSLLLVFISSPYCTLLVGLLIRYSNTDLKSKC